MWKSKSSPNPFEKKLLALARHDLSATAIRLYFWLGELDDSKVYPGSERMSGLLGSSRGNVTRAEHALVEAGLLTFTPRGHNQRAFKLAPVPRLDPQQLADYQAIFDPDALPAAAIPQTQTAPAPTASREPKLTDEMIQWFTSSPEHMELYLRFGSHSYQKSAEDCQGLPSTQTDWLAHKPERIDVPWTNEWKIGHYMGYYWAGVCRWRQSAGVCRVGMLEVSGDLATRGDARAQTPRSTVERCPGTSSRGLFDAPESPGGPLEALEKFGFRRRASEQRNRTSLTQKCDQDHEWRPPQ